MDYLKHDSQKPRKGSFGLTKSEFLSAKSGAVEAIADEVILRRSLVNPSLFSLIVERYQDGFLRSAYRVVRSTEEAEDIAQEAFIKIYKNGKKFKVQPGASFKSWAYKILMNTAFTRYRKLKKKDVNLEEFFDVILYEGAKNAQRAELTQLETKNRVELALAEIPDELANLIKLHYFEGYSYDDISSMLGLPISTLKMRLYRARNIVKKYLA